MIKWVKKMDKEQIEKEMEQIIEQNQYKKIKEGLYLTNYQESVLKEHHIDYQNCESARDILFLLEDTFDDEEFEDLEEIARQIEEYSYYNETNK